MNFYSASAISVPTKKDSPSEVRGFGNGMGGNSSSSSNGTPNNGLRRNSSSSSLDVAATIFSSMQELEASGRNLSSLGTLSALQGQGLGDDATSALESALGGMGHLAGMGGGMMGSSSPGVSLSSLNGMMGGVGHHQGSSSLAAARERLGALHHHHENSNNRSFSRNNSCGSLNVEDMLASAGFPMGGGAGAVGVGVGVGESSSNGLGQNNSSYNASIQAQAQALRRLEMEEIMLAQKMQHQNTNQHQHQMNHQQMNHQQMNQQQMNQQQMNHQQMNQRSALLGNLKGGYAPMQSSQSRRLSRSLLDDFTPAELLQEVTRRQSQRRNSRDFLAEAGASAAGDNSNHNVGGRRPSSASLMDALSRTSSRDDLVDLYNQMRHRGSTGGTERAMSLNSLSSMALMAGMNKNNPGLNSNSGGDDQQSREGRMSAMSVPQELEGFNKPAITMPPRSTSHDSTDIRNLNNSGEFKGEGVGEPQQKKRRDSETELTPKQDVVVIVPTAKPDSKLVGKMKSLEGVENRSSSSDATNSTVVTDTQSPRPETKLKELEGITYEGIPKKLTKKKRNNSTASFDALLSVFADELTELDKEKDKTDDDDKSHASGASVSFFNNLIEKTAAATAAARQKQEEENAVEAVKDKRRLSSSSSLSDYPRLSQADENRLERECSNASSQDQLLAAAAASNKIGTDRVRSHMDALLDRGGGWMPQGLGGLMGRAGDSSFTPTFKNSNGGMLNSTLSPADYTRNMQSTASMMASLEAMRQEELAMKERALREGALRELELQAHQVRSRGLGLDGKPTNNGMSGHNLGPLQNGMMNGRNGLNGLNPSRMPPGLDPDMARLASLFGERFPPGLMGDPPPIPQTMAADVMMRQLQGLGQGGQPPLTMNEQLNLFHHKRHMLSPNHPLNLQDLMRSNNNNNRPPHPAIIPATVTKPRTPPPEKPIHPEIQLKRFLEEHGEPAEKFRSKMLEAISETEKSLVAIHAWDRNQGLRKCHSRTVVKTRRSRAKVKAFLMGLDQPKEPAKKRKRAVGKKAKKARDDASVGDIEL